MAPRKPASPAPAPLDPELVASLIDAGSREHYADAVLYDHEYRRRRADVTFYRQLARDLLGASGGRILELGCGSGRVSVPLARDGFEVVGVDGSPAMLAQLEARRARLPAAVAGRLRAVQADLREVALGQRFPLVIAPFNVFEHLYTRADFGACLARVAAHLAPGGALAFDVQLPDLAWLARDPDRRWARTRFKHPRTGQPVEYSTNHDYDPVTQVALIRLYYQPLDSAGAPRGRPTIVKLTQRKFFPVELEALLEASGFLVTARFGDFHGEELAAGAMSQVLVATLWRPGR
jgi:SAM-dependent methyltransferase